MQAVTSSTRSALDNQSLRRCFPSQSEVEAIVRSKVAGVNVNRAAVRAVVQIESRKLDDARVAAVETDVSLLDSLLVDLGVDCGVVLWPVAGGADGGPG